MAILSTAVLLIESNPADTQLIQNALMNADGLFSTAWVTSLAAALQYLRQNIVDVILLDVALPDGIGLDAFNIGLAAR